MRKLKLGLLATASAIASFASSANAGQLQPYGQFGWWSVTYDAEDRTCGMKADFNNGIRIAVMILPPGADGKHDIFMSFGSRNWTNVRDGSRYEGTMLFNDGAYGFRGTFAGIAPSANVTGVVASETLNYDFMKSFMQAYNVTFTLNGRVMAKFSLEGTMGASLMLGRCQSDMDASAPAPQRQPPQPPPASPAPRNPPPGYQGSGTSGGTYQM
jgi:hypothetical protein